MKIDRIISKIEEAESKLCEADNNLRYIKALQALKYWLIKFDNMFQTKNVNGANIVLIMRLISFLVAFRFLIV